MPKRITPARPTPPKFTPAARPTAPQPPPTPPGAPIVIEVELPPPPGPSKYDLLAAAARAFLATTPRDPYQWTAELHERHRAARAALEALL